MKTHSHIRPAILDNLIRKNHLSQTRGWLNAPTGLTSRLLSTSEWIQYSPRVRSPGRHLPPGMKCDPREPPQPNASGFNPVMAKVNVCPPHQEHVRGPESKHELNAQTGNHTKANPRSFQWRPVPFGLISCV
ncbi:hypothetical protein BDP81DRAFT_438703 [Colletotrichum phormii]|uniref:Uncharacterized protein n=1 Tax=Colletotrichum phormii TaxID=359342 RepID=A0AAI9ZHL5_9PEZI|nr:uncharacterized protein BDP81DRAFT_438703 [Colletotrichum phormii]KAK1623710.1 hypothetical protein BDP81DRAFT_438703 [Colletotrichum phormii]